MGILKAFLRSFSPTSFLGDVAFLLLIYVCFSFIFSSKTYRHGPPGPKPLPLLGNLLQLDFKRLDRTFVEFSKKYGSVFAIYLGQRKVVILAGYQTVKEAFVNYAEEFGDRDVPIVAKDTNLDHGIAWVNGDSWKEMRRFALTNLKDFGMGKKACEDKIIEEFHKLIKEFKKFKGEAFDMAQLMNFAVCNIICSMVYGNRFEYGDPEFQTVINKTGESLNLLGTPAIKLYTLFPSLGKLLFSARKKLKTTFEDNKRHHLTLLNRLRETLNPQMFRGVADVFIARQQQLKESEISTSNYTDENLLAIVINLFAAGTETTLTTLRWGLLFLTKHPKIQAKVQEELNTVVGSRQVQVQDKQNLPFTNAVIHEIQRLANIVPLALAHSTSKDVIFQGHFIEKGTIVFPLLTTVLHDESEWEKPYDFHPAHFLDKDGNFTKRDAFLPFSAGRRICPGESLAKMELFIFFTTFLQHFRFTPPPGVSEEDLDLTALPGGTLRPQPHKLCAVSLK
ncbi:cytochrome P450 2K1 [Kryptolebias marmoratus]|uniref:cytochrome P450 2K1 n=1 Tax=Kryptolebias marmoratus TaxID=37003 RepID=UPI0007F93AD8|nr:cytochrome P450 2K1 [Kryptolebias marmoratus]